MIVVRVMCLGRGRGDWTKSHLSSPSSSTIVVRSLVNCGCSPSNLY